MIDIRYDAHFDFMKPRSLSFFNYFHSYSVELRLLSFNILILHFSFLALLPFIFPFYFMIVCASDPNWASEGRSRGYVGAYAPAERRRR